jgi:hypothetical protein
MTDNVQKFPGATALPDNPMEIAPRRLGWCSHEAVTLDEHTRTDGHCRALARKPRCAA